MKQLIALLSLTFMLILSSSISYAVQPDEILDDPILEARARAISLDLRCLVCQNQSIDDSDADLARDLRIIVRERLVAGDSDRQVKDFLVDRYGSYVLLDPPMNVQTLLLWAGPLIILLLAFFTVFMWYRGRLKDSGTLADTDPAEQKLSAEQQARLDVLLKD